MQQKPLNIEPKIYILPIEVQKQRKHAFISLSYVPSQNNHQFSTLYTNLFNCLSNQFHWLDFKISNQSGGRKRLHSPHTIQDRQLTISLTLLYDSTTNFLYKSPANCDWSIKVLAILCGLKFIFKPIDLRWKYLMVCLYIFNLL